MVPLRYLIQGQVQPLRTLKLKQFYSNDTFAISFHILTTSFLIPSPDSSHSLFLVGFDQICTFFAHTVACCHDTNHVISIVRRTLG